MSADVAQLVESRSAIVRLCPSEGMQVCQKCEALFPVKAVVNGQRRNLQRRKYCLTCSPWGQRNTRKLHIALLETKRCQGICGKVLPLDQFYRHKNGQFHSYCRECDRQRQRDRCKTIKEQAVAYKGGACALCGYNRCAAAMDFHHPDPGAKDFSISSRKGQFDDTVKAEVDKCILLCSNCHREAHAGIQDVPTQA